MRNRWSFVLLLAVGILAVAGCRPLPAQALPAETGAPTAEATPAAPAGTPESAATPQSPESVPDAPVVAGPVEYVLETQVADSGFIFVGVGGDIAGVVNPDLSAAPGATVHVTLVNGDGIPHDFAVPDFNAKTRVLSGRGQSAELSFVVAADQAGSFAYYCTVPGHRQSGQEGRLVVAATAR
jgi:nitrite reductase (NO-forming)